MTTLRKFFSFIALFALALAILGFTLANRQAVRVVLDPVAARETASAIEMPLFLLLLAAILVGFAVGVVSTWWGQGKWRRVARARGREIKSLSRETERLNRQLKLVSVQPPADRERPERALFH